MTEFKNITTNPEFSDSNELEKIYSLHYSIFLDIDNSAEIFNKLGNGKKSIEIIFNCIGESRYGLMARYHIHTEYSKLSNLILQFRSNQFGDFISMLLAFRHVLESYIKIESMHKESKFDTKYYKDGVIYANRD